MTRNSKLASGAIGGALLVGSLVLLGGVAAAGSPAFPWSGDVTLYDKGGKTLGWSVRHDGGNVIIGGKSPAWTVLHRARADGTPLSTTKTKGSRTTTLTYKPGGATFSYEDGSDAEATEISESGTIWDGDTLDVRLPGIAWAPGKVVRFKIIDTDSDDGDVYGMVAKYIGLETCRSGPCHHVKVNLSGWRASVGPKWHFWFGTAPGAPYLKFEGRIGTFEAR